MRRTPYLLLLLGLPACQAAFSLSSAAEAVKETAHDLSKKIDEASVYGKCAIIGIAACILFFPRWGLLALLHRMTRRLAGPSPWDQARRR